MASADAPVKDPVAQQQQGAEEQPTEPMSAEWAHLVELATADDGMYDDDTGPDGKPKQSNILPIWGNVKTMNLNNVILQNILASPYFKNYLFNMKTYHEVVDEIYSQVSHLEPWEKGSRKTTGQVGMCGGVRGVGAGGIVSSAYCLLFKLFTLHLTRRQLQGLMNNRNSPYTRGLGFMYARYCIQPQDLWEWYERYIDDEEEVDVKAGGGHTMTIGELLRHFLTKLDWYSTLFPRIPIPIQKRIMEQLEEHDRQYAEGAEGAEEEEEQAAEVEPPKPVARAPVEAAVVAAEKASRDAKEAKEKDASYGQMLSKELERHHRVDPSVDKSSRRTRSRSRSRGHSRSRRYSDDRRRRDSEEERRGRRSGGRRSRSRSRSRHRSRSDSRSRRRRTSRQRERSPSDSRYRADRRGVEPRRGGREEDESKRPGSSNNAPPGTGNEEEDEDYGHVERLLRRAAARKAAMAKGDSSLDDELGLGGGLNSGARKGGRPNVFI